jgi:hypothetical protein
MPEPKSGWSREFDEPITLPRGPEDPPLIDGLHDGADDRTASERSSHDSMVAPHILHSKLFTRTGDAPHAMHLACFMVLASLLAKRQARYT